MTISVHDTSPQQSNQDQDFDTKELAARLGECVDEWVPVYFPNARRTPEAWRLADISGRAPRKDGSCLIDRRGVNAGCWKEFGPEGGGGGPLDTLLRGAGVPFGKELLALATNITRTMPRAPRHSNGHDREAKARHNLNEAETAWAQAVPIAGTLGQTYLLARGIDFIPPGDLRYHDNLTFWETRTGEPALVARFTYADGSVAAGGSPIHRIYLRRDGSWHVKKMMLGSARGDGSARSGGDGSADGMVIRLAEPEVSGGAIGVGTGIETTLAAMKLFGVAGMAAASDGGLRKFGLWLSRMTESDPEGFKRYTSRVKCLLIWADRKHSGVAAAGELLGVCMDLGIPAELCLPTGPDDFADDLAKGVRGGGVREVSPAIAAPATPAEIEKATDPLNRLINEFNERYAVVSEQGKTVIYEEANDEIFKRDVIYTLSKSDLLFAYENAPLSITRVDGKVETKTKAQWWLQHPKRRQYLKGVGFDPTGKLNSGNWNLWRGFPIKPIKGDWSNLQKHIFEVVCSENQQYFDYIMNWFSRMFQYPQLQGEVAVVLRGQQGTGKGIVFNHIVEAWGQHGIRVSNSDHLVGKFNHHLRDCVALFADEALFAGDRRHNSTLKSLITEPTIAIEKKRFDVINVKNMLHIMMASNEEWVIPAGLHERRYFVLDVSDKKLGNRDYFKKIYNQMSDGGLSAMLYDFINHELNEFEVRDVPETEILKEQKEFSSDILDRWWIEVLQRGHVLKSKFANELFDKWHSVVTSEMLRQSISQWCAQNRVNYPPGGALLGRRLVSMYQHVRPRGRALVGEAEAMPFGLSSAARYADHQHAYVLGDIDQAIAAFERVRGLRVEPGNFDPGSKMPPNPLRDR